MPTECGVVPALSLLLKHYNNVTIALQLSLNLISILNQSQIIKNDGEEFHCLHHCTEAQSGTVSLMTQYQSSIKMHYAIEEPSIFQPRHLQCTLASEAI